MELRQIPGYEGLYAAREDGAIVRLKGASGTQPGRVLKPVPNRNGYLYYHLSQHAQVKCFTAQSLVAAAFIGPRPDGHDVMHMNAVKHDNRPSNLQYGTRSENQLHAVETGHHAKFAKQQNEQNISA